MEYRLEYMDHKPGQYGPEYGDCWWPVMPNRAYTRIETAKRLMREHAKNSQAPAFIRGVTRIVAIESDGKREVAILPHDAWDWDILP